MKFTNLNQAATLLDGEITAQGGAFALRMSKVLDRWFALFINEVGPKKPVSVSRSRTLLAKAGYDAAVDTSLAALPRVIKSAAVVLKAAGKTLPQEQSTLNAYFNLKTMEFKAYGDKLAAQLATISGKATLTKQNLGEVVNELREVIDVAVPPMQTLFETAMAEFAQLLIALGAGAEPDDVFIYAGPLDARIRPFCLERVGRVYSRDAIDKMDNRQLPNTFLTRGGYNCRHQWIPVTGSSLAALADTGKHADAPTRRAVEGMRTALKGSKHKRTA